MKSSEGEQEEPLQVYKKKESQTMLLANSLVGLSEKQDSTGIQKDKRQNLSVSANINDSSIAEHQVPEFNEVHIASTKEVPVAKQESKTLDQGFPRACDTPSRQPKLIMDFKQSRTIEPKSESFSPLHKVGIVTKMPNNSQHSFINMGHHSARQSLSLSSGSHTPITRAHQLRSSRSNEFLKRNNKQNSAIHASKTPLPKRPSTEQALYTSSKFNQRTGTNLPFIQEESTVVTQNINTQIPTNALASVAMNTAGSSPLSPQPEAQSSCENLPLLQTMKVNETSQEIKQPFGEYQTEKKQGHFQPDFTLIPNEQTGQFMDGFPKSLFSPKISQGNSRVQLRSPTGQEKIKLMPSKRKSQSQKDLLQKPSILSQELRSPQPNQMMQLQNFHTATSPIMFTSPIPPILGADDRKIQPQARIRSNFSSMQRREHIKNKFSDATLSTQQIQEISDIAYKRGFDRGDNLLINTQSDMGRSQKFITNREFRTNQAPYETVATEIENDSAWVMKRFALKMQQMGFNDQRIERAMCFGKARSVEELLDCLAPDRRGFFQHKFHSLRKVQRQMNSWCQFCTASFFGYNNGILPRKQKDYHCKMVPEISAAQQQSILENSKHEQPRKLAETDETGFYRRLEQKRMKAESPHILLDNSSAFILGGGTTRGETKFQNNIGESTQRSDRDLQVLKKPQQKSIEVFYYNKIIRVNQLLAEYPLRVPRTEEFLTMLQMPEAKRDKQQTLQGVEYRLISKQKRKYKQEAFELLLKLKRKIVEQPRQKPAAKINAVSNISKPQPVLSHAQNSKNTTKPSSNALDSAGHKNPRKPYIMKQIKNQSKEVVELFSASSIRQEQIGEQNVSLDQFPLSGISRPPDRHAKADSFSDNFVSSGGDSFFHPPQDESNSDVCAICMESLEKHSIDHNLFLYEHLLPHLLANPEDELRRREYRRNMGIPSLNTSVSAMLQNQALMTHKAETPKRLEDSINGSFYAFPAYRNRGDVSSDRGQFVTLSNNASVDRTLIRKDSSMIFHTSLAKQTHPRIQGKRGNFLTEQDRRPRIMHRTQNDLLVSRAQRFISNNSLSNTEQSAGKLVDFTRTNRSYHGGKKHSIGEPIPVLAQTQLEGIRESAEASPGHFTHKQINLITDSLIKICPLCTQTRFKLIDLPCEHSFCSICLVRYFQAEIYTTRGSRICCPECVCLIPDSILKAVLNDGHSQALELYWRLRRQTSLITETYCVYCPSEKCSHLIQFSESIKMLFAKQAHIGTKCPKCQYLFCARCEIQLNNNQLSGTCGEGIEWKYAQKCRFQQIQLCPVCSMPAMKYDKCNHTACKTCNQRYCLLCRKTYSQDHFNYFSESMCLAFVLDPTEPDIQESLKLLNYRRATNSRKQHPQSTFIPLWRVLLIFLLGILLTPLLAFYLVPLVFSLNTFQYLYGKQDKRCTKPGAFLVAVLIFLIFLGLSPITIAGTLVILLLFLLVFGIKGCFCACRKRKQSDLQFSLEAMDPQPRVNKAGGEV